MLIKSGRMSVMYMKVKNEKVFRDLIMDEIKKSLD